MSETSWCHSRAQACSTEKHSLSSTMYSNSILLSGEEGLIDSSKIRPNHINGVHGEGVWGASPAFLPICGETPAPPSSLEERLM